MILDRLLDLEKNPTALPYTARAYDLEGFRRWLQERGSPQAGQLFVHLAGTKGKGSTAAVVEGLLRGLGFPTALYTSPHLQHFGERYRIDGQPWTQATFEQALERLVDAMPEEQRQVLDGPHRYRTTFEFLTMLALVEFGERGRQVLRSAPDRPPQIVCWETGMGGRLDCTNVVDPLVTIITTLGLDHTAVLGKEIEQIAGEKAGIIKPHRPVVVSRQAPEFAARVLPILERRAEELSAPVIRAWEHTPVLQARPDRSGQSIQLRLPDGRIEESHLPLAGQFQQGNLEAAASAAWLVAETVHRLPDGDFLRGLADVHWPGRMEVHPQAQGAVLILDGAHCPLSARSAVQAVQDWQAAGALQVRRPLEILWGMQRDKEHAAFLRGLAEGAAPDFFGGLHTYPVPGPRGANPETLAEVARAAGWHVTPHSDPETALRAAQQTGRDILAVGTLYAIVALRQAWLTSAGPTPQ